MRVELAAQCALVLVEEDGGGALGGGLGQFHQRSRGDRIDLRLGEPLAPREFLAAALDKRSQDGSRRGMAAVAMNLDPRRSGARGDHFFAGRG